MPKSFADMTPAELEQATPQALDRLAAHLNAQPPLRLELDPWAAFQVAASLQLALRHPRNAGPTARFVRGLVDDLIVHLSAGDVEIAVLLHRGDDANYDVSTPHEAAPDVDS